MKTLPSQKEFALFERTAETSGLSIIQDICEINNSCDGESQLADAKYRETMYAVKLFDAYKNNGFAKEFTIAALKRRLEYIKEATTKKELNEIHKSPKPALRAGRIENGTAYYMPEEECMMWSIASLKAPLTHEATERYMYLFESITGLDPRTM